MPCVAARNIGGAVLIEEPQVDNTTPMQRESLITLAVLVAAAGGIGLLCWTLFRSMILYRLVDAARQYPNISLCLAMSSRGNVVDAESFRRWLVDTVDKHGWEGADRVLGEMLARTSLGDLDFSAPAPDGEPRPEGSDRI